MCTLITLFRYHASAPLVVALNRDEFLGRPTRPPEFWEESPADAPIVAGRDLQAGGTWFGIGRHVVAGLTNHRRPDAKRGPTTRDASRGKLVVEALKSKSAEAASQVLLKAEGEKYGPFHLLVSDREQMRWITNRRGPMESHAVEPGLHVLGNLGLDEGGDPVVASMQQELADCERLGEAELKIRLKEALAMHGAGRPCVHYSELYGTRSSALLFWGRPRSEYEITEEPPCRAEWIDRSPLLKMLGSPK